MAAGVAGITLTGGWAENGTQMSRGATRTLESNNVRDHWWDKNDFLSSGVIVFGSDSIIALWNNFVGNDAGMAFIGDDNNGIHNAWRRHRARSAG